jgi:hypothetical protein
VVVVVGWVTGDDVFDGFGFGIDTQLVRASATNPSNNRRYMKLNRPGFLGGS